MKTERSRIFAETYQGYLAEIRKIDFLARAPILGVVEADGALIIPLYDRCYTFTAQGIAESKALTPALQVMICKYILSCPEQLPASEGELVTYREFKDAGPLISYFTTNTNKTLESAFAGNTETLRQRALTIGGKVRSSEVYDLSLEFYAFPRIPVYLNFNDRDDTFAAACSILYRSSAALFLDMECLALTGTLLTGKLLDGGTDVL